MNVVWFKRDLRLDDNLALTLALQNGSVLPLYIIEPELWYQPDMSRRQYQFLSESLIELDESLKQLGQKLVIKVGSAIEVFQSLEQQKLISAIYSHQETWNGWTFDRDIKVKTWTKSNNIAWHELKQNGVIRGLKSRNGWAKNWYQFMSQPCLPKPHNLQSIAVKSDKLPSAEELNLKDDLCGERQLGGRAQGIKYLESFLGFRGQHYSKEMSSPLTAYDSCSRLSPYLAFGCLSVREVFQAVESKKSQIKKQVRGNKSKWSLAMRSFSSRLRWHCHFMQKLEDEPRLEFQNLHSAYNGLRENSFNQVYFDAWKQGNTGFPMIDACMRSLIATGWLNFRMRAMLMSFASQHLWLHWRATSLHLARLFTDYEPGIHYSQAQMQSGTTGINSIRIYNPIKQSVDQDPEGMFIRHWIPELIDMPNSCIHTPWAMPSKLNGYPLPIVDEAISRRMASDRLYKLRKNYSHFSEASKIVDKHASRKKNRKPRTTKTENTKQRSLF